RARRAPGAVAGLDVEQGGPVEVLRVERVAGLVVAANDVAADVALEGAAERPQGLLAALGRPGVAQHALDTGQLVGLGGGVRPAHKTLEHVPPSRSRSRVTRRRGGYRASGGSGE